MDEEKNEDLDKMVEDLQQKFVDLIKERDEKLETQIKEIEASGKASESLGEELKEANEAIERIRLQFEEFRHQVGDLGEIVGPSRKSVFDQIKESEVLENFARGRIKSGRMTIPIEGSIFGPGVEGKTTVDSTVVGSSTAGILTPDRVRDIVLLARRRFTLRDLLPSRVVSSNAIEYPTIASFTSAASPQVEASAKGESAMTFSIGTANVRTIAHWIPATTQVLDDWPALERIINDHLLYYLKLKEEEEILTGDGTGVHLNGLVTAATAYAGTYNVAADTNLDRLRWAILEAEDDDEEVDFIVLNPVNFWTIMGIKDQATNVGNYVIGNPTTVPQPMTFWNRAVIVTNTMTSGTFLVGSTRMCEVFDRQQANVVLSTEHASYFTQNMVAIRAEERIALAVYRAAAFIYGSF